MLHNNWKKITTAIARAMQSCKTLGVNIDDHFREVTKMITLAENEKHLQERSQRLPKEKE